MRKISSQGIHLNTSYPHMRNINYGKNQRRDSSHLKNTLSRNILLVNGLNRQTHFTTNNSNNLLATYTHIKIVGKIRFDHCKHKY